jgi:TLD
VKILKKSCLEHTFPHPGNHPQKVRLFHYMLIPDNFGDKHSILFQLLPNHTIYPSASYHTQFAYFNPRVGLGFGCPPPQLPRRGSFTAQTIISHTSDPQVSLSLDSALELAVFTHTPPGATFSSNIAQGEYGYKIMVDEVEVWGCGVDNARDEQKRAWEYERTEAERRQNVRVREDLASDRALLEMAGIIGANRSGGSI